jgi:hypothetical protein
MRFCFDREKNQNTVERTHRAGGDGSDGTSAVVRALTVAELNFELWIVDPAEIRAAPQGGTAGGFRRRRSRGLGHSHRYRPAPSSRIFLFLLVRYDRAGSQTGWMRGSFLRRHASRPGDRWSSNFESVPVGFSVRVTRYPLLFAYARHLHRVRLSRVACNTPVQRLRNLLAVAVVAQLPFIGGTADERNFRQDRWH